MTGPFAKPPYRNDRSFEDAEETLREALGSPALVDTLGPGLVDWWRKAVLATGGPTAFGGGAVDHDTAAFLLGRAATKGEDPVIIEVGSGIGYSTAVLSAGARSVGRGTVESVDNSPAWMEKAKSNVARLPWADAVTFVEWGEWQKKTYRSAADIFFIDAEDSIRRWVLPRGLDNGSITAKTEVYLHDAHREGEKAMMATWAKLFDLKPRMVVTHGRGLARISKRG